MSYWISVEDQVPEEWNVVIVEGGVAYRSGREWFTITGEAYPGKIIQWPVTHWMPLPRLYAAKSSNESSNGQAKSF